jgi:hypothetical protein
MHTGAHDAPQSDPISPKVSCRPAANLAGGGGRQRYKCRVREVPGPGRRGPSSRQPVSSPPAPLPFQGLPQPLRKLARPQAAGGAISTQRAAPSVKVSPGCAKTPAGAQRGSGSHALPQVTPLPLARLRAEGCIPGSSSRPAAARRGKPALLGKRRCRTQGRQPQSGGAACDLVRGGSPFSARRRIECWGWKLQGSCDGREGHGGIFANCVT